MDDEELDLGTTGKKITVNNFFESIRDIDQVASDATKSILEQGVTIEGIIKSIAKIEKEIIEIKSFIRIQKDLEEDRLLEAQDAEQKERRRLELESEFGGEENKEKKSRKDQNAPGDFGLNAREKAAAAITSEGGSALGGIALQLPSLIKGIFGFAEGGKVSDTDNDKTNNDEDSVPAMLTPGEFVITKDAVKKIGVDTLKGINAAAGGTNKPKLMEGTLGKGPAAKLGVMSKEFLGFSEEGDIETAERSMRRDEEGHVEKTYFDGSTDIYESTADDGSEYFYDKSEMIGSSLKEESISRYRVEETLEDGSKETFFEEAILKSETVDIAVDDMITHKDQLMSEVNKLEGFEKVTFKQILNGTHGIPNELLFPILAKSNASKATAKKKDKAEQLDRKQGILPSSAYRNPTTFGYRINQINPPSIFRAQESLDEKSRLDFKYDSKNDPTLAKGKKGVKGFSEGGLVKKDNGLSILNQLKTLTDPTKSSFANKLKETADKDTLGLENFARSFSEGIGGKEGLQNIAGGVTKQVFSQFNDSISDEGGGGLVKDLINELMPQLLPEDVADMISASQDPMPPNANSPITVPQTPPNNQTVEIVSPDDPSTAINLLKKMSRDNLNITVTTSNDLMSEIPEILKLIK